MNRKHRARREFLHVSAAALTAGYTATALGYQANETIRVGLIGTGGRCRHLLGALTKLPGVKVVALCDVWDVHLEQTKKMLPGEPWTTKNFPELLARKDVDAVLIATPDHWHAPLTIAACESGKDVYVEKPLTHKLHEGPAIIAAQHKHRRVVQVGMQQRSMPQIQKGRELIQSGRIGSVHKVHLTWNRNAPRGIGKPPVVDPKTVDWKMFLGNAREQPFDAYRFRDWRWFWDFGGGILTDLMVHWLDVANWCLELPPPKTAVTIGDNVQTAGLWNTPDTIQTLLHYPERKTQVYFEGTFVNARNASMIEIMGTEGTIYMDRGRLELHPERGKGEYFEWILGKDRPRGADFFATPDGESLHLADWLACVRSRKTPSAPAEAGVAAVWGAHLGNRAFREQCVAQWAGPTEG